LPPNKALEPTAAQAGELDAGGGGRRRLNAALGSRMALHVN
jgi:hypothetical protein